MSFANFRFLALIPLFILLMGVCIWFGQYQQRKLSRWIDQALWKDVIPEFSKTIFLTKKITLLFVFILLSVCVARPQWGEREEILKSEGMDLLFVLDLSNSMSAEDISPSRLKRAQTFIKKTIALLPNDRAGVVGFAGSAYLAVPLTTDFGYVADVVDSLDPSIISNQGTNLGQALDVAMKAFERGAEDDHKTSRAVILISDGEDFGTDAMKAAQALKDFGAGFFTFSVGTAEGSPIPIRNENGVLQTYKKDLSGKTVLTRVNKELMSQVAEAGGGKFLDLVNPDDASYSLSRLLLTFGRTSQKDQREVTKIDRFQWFLLIAIFILLLNLFTGYQKKISPLAAFFLFSMIFPSLPQARAESLDSYFLSKKGMKQYETGEFESSAKSFEESRKDNPDSSVLQFNEGTALAKGKKAEDAIFHFQESTKKALSQGDYETAAKSLYNEGITQSENKNLKEAYDRLTKSIEMAKISNQSELEKKGRDALFSLIEQQKQQSQDQKNQKNNQDKKDDPNSKNKSSPSEDDSEKKDQGKPEDSNKKNPTQADQRSFKSGTLSKDVAESIMHDLSDREKQLYQKRMKDKRPRENNHDKDW